MAGDGANHTPIELGDQDNGVFVGRQASESLEYFLAPCRVA